MAATVTRFGSAVTLPKAVYLETSFIWEALGQEVAGGGASLTFLTTLGHGHVELLTSPFSVEECIGNAVFKYGILPDLRSAMTSGGISELRRTRPGVYSASHAKHVPKTDQLMTFLQRRGVGIDFPSWDESGDGDDKAGAEAVCSLACRYLAKYASLDTMDAFHVAVHKILGTDAMVSNDGGFQDVDGIDVFAP